MKSGGKTMDAVRGKTWDSKQVKLSKPRLESVRMDIKTKRLLACKSPTIKTVAQMKAAKCLQKFVTSLYKGGKNKSGGSVFRGRAPRLSSLSARNRAEYLARVKSVLVSTGVTKKAAPPPVVVRPPVVTPPPSATKPENDAALKKVMRMAAQSAYTDFCDDAAESAPVGGNKQCKDVPVAAAGVYKMFKQVSLDGMPPALKAKVIAKFKAGVAAKPALAQKYPNVNEAMLKKMWAASGYGTEQPEDAPPPRRKVKTEKSEKSEKPVKKKDDGKLGRLILMGGAGFSIQSGEIGTSLPEDGTKPNKLQMWAIDAAVDVGYRVAPKLYLGGRVGIFYSKFKPTVIDSTTNETEPGGKSMFGGHVGPMVMYNATKGLWLHAALMLGGYKADEVLSMGVIGRKISFTNAHFAFEAGLKYMFGRHFWVGAKFQALVGLGESFNQIIKNQQQLQGDGYATMKNFKLVLGAGVSFDFL